MQAFVTRLFFTFYALVLLGSLAVGLTGCWEQPEQSRQQLLSQAEADLKAGKFHKALSELNQVLQDDPNNVRVHVDLGWVYLYTGQLEKASAEVLMAEKLNDSEKNPGLHYLKGAVYARLEQWVDALEAYNEALKGDINNPQLHADIAHAFLKVNAPDAARREYAVALKLDPANTAYGFGECIAYRQLKQYNEALKACNRAAESADSPEEHLQIGEVVEQIKLLQRLEENTSAAQETTHNN